MFTLLGEGHKIVQLVDDKTNRDVITFLPFLKYSPSGFKPSIRERLKMQESAEEP